MDNNNNKQNNNFTSRISSSWLDGNLISSLFGEKVFVSTIDVIGQRLQSSAQGLDVVLVIDVSGSMSPAMGQVRQMVKAVGENLRSTDRLSVVTFSTESKVVYPLKSTDASSEEFLGVVESLVASGGTNISMGLMTGLNVLRSEGSTQNIALLMLLSDGQPTDGIQDPAELLEALKSTIATDHPHQAIVLHSFGFTSNHDSSMLSLVTSAGNLDAGMYYFIQEDKDIPAALGDCIGVYSSLSCKKMTLSISEIPESFQCHILTDSLDLQTIHHSVSLGSLGLSQKYTWVILCWKTNTSTTLPDSQKILIKLKSAESDEECIVINIPAIPLQEDIPTPLGTENGTEMDIVQNESKQIEKLYVTAHTLRMKVALYLLRAMDSSAISMVAEMEELHDMILETLGEVQQIESDLMTQLEGLLEILERDLGAAIERLQSSYGKLSSRLQARFLQFAHEHQNQRSASTSTHLRTTYATNQQTTMRIRFLSGKNADEQVVAEKESIVEEPDLTEEERKKRMEMNTNTCFASLDNWKETTLGIGLLVRPRTTRERRKNLMPVIELVEDYVSADSYNSGIRVNFSNNSNLNREDEETEETHLVIKSSVRSRINGWLPLYINAVNWKHSKSWACSAFSIIATQFNDLFQPIHALKVCAKLMIQSIVKFTLLDARVSEKALQMYCDVHRLFLAMADDYPEVRITAEEALEQFINEPTSRNRTITPDLGDLIQYLTITQKFNWDQMKEAYLVEAIRRNTLHIDHTILHEIQDIDGILQFWENNTSNGKVTLFSILFMKTIMMNGGGNLEKIKENYDRRWGRISDEVLNELKTGFHKILSISSVVEVFEHMGVPRSKEAIAETILWGFEHTDDKSPGLKYLTNGVPAAAGLNYEIWQTRVNLLIQSKLNSPTLQLQKGPPNHKRRRSLSSCSHMLTLLASEGAQWEVEEIEYLGPNAKQARWMFWEPSQNIGVDCGSLPECVLFLGKLPRYLVEKDLLEAFLPYLPPDLQDPSAPDFPLKVRISRNWKGKSNKYAFAEFTNPQFPAQILEKLKKEQKEITAPMANEGPTMANEGSGMANEGAQILNEGSGMVNEGTEILNEGSGVANEVIPVTETANRFRSSEGNIEGTFMKVHQHLILVDLERGRSDPTFQHWKRQKPNH